MPHPSPYRDPLQIVRIWYNLYGFYLPRLCSYQNSPDTPAASAPPSPDLRPRNLSIVPTHTGDPRQTHLPHLQPHRCSRYPYAYVLLSHKSSPPDNIPPHGCALRFLPGRMQNLPVRHNIPLYADVLPILRFRRQIPPKPDNIPAYVHVLRILPGRRSARLASGTPAYAPRSLLTHMPIPPADCIPPCEYALPARSVRRPIGLHNIPLHAYALPDRTLPYPSWQCHTVSGSPLRL